MVVWCFIGVGGCSGCVVRAGGEVEKESSASRKKEIIFGSFANDSCVDWTAATADVTIFQQKTRGVFIVLSFGYCCVAKILW